MSVSELVYGSRREGGYIRGHRTYVLANRTSRLLSSRRARLISSGRSGTIESAETEGVGPFRHAFTDGGGGLADGLDEGESMGVGRSGDGGNSASRFGWGGRGGVVDGWDRGRTSDDRLGGGRLSRGVNGGGFFRQRRRGDDGDGRGDLARDLRHVRDSGRAGFLSVSGVLDGEDGRGSSRIGLVLGESGDGVGSRTDHGGRVAASRGGDRVVGRRSISGGLGK
jgi:hypothetical protein